MLAGPVLGGFYPAGYYPETASDPSRWFGLGGKIIPIITIEKESKPLSIDRVYHVATIEKNGSKIEVKRMEQNSVIEKEAPTRKRP